ncbi:hypothetical protein N7517_003667 [Penicillium concentricum]|uniref:Uncharacterized protein n=1 Tax=Penicillium concentricum TaxID=293559 RepID=A0A9W9S439_9EURO|nr:uncharacterized protein N7517_003667 [Penicillium concentricum]KAJ5371661.1 hypothetical protein N7517_003667 [Penicillium concentricum]
MVATIIAARVGTAAVEIHIMLQFMLGSFITTLSTVGVRLWLMSPDRLAKLEAKTTAALKSFWDAEKSRLSHISEPSTPMSKGWWLDILTQGELAVLIIWSRFSSPTFTLQEQRVGSSKPPLNILSALKPPELSWSGVSWRMGTAAVIAGYNLAFWFDNSGSGAQQPPREGCGPPYIFLFSKQQLAGPIVALCRATAVIIVIAVFPATLLLLHLTMQLWWYAGFFLYRDLLYFFNPAAPQAVHSALSRVNALLEKQGIPFLSLVPLPVLGSFAASITVTDVLGFLATPKGDAIRFSDVIKVCVSLGTGKVTKNETDTSMHGVGLMSGWKKAKRRHRNFCSLWNVYVVLSIAWFIASIEYTIHWNDIHSVNDMKTTGQLIPFIIGCKYPDWVDTELELEDGENGPLIFKIVKRNRGDDSEEDATREDHIGND